MSLTEFDLIESYFYQRARPRKDVKLGIGDDGALLNVPAGQHLVVTMDTLVSGVHFPANILRRFVTRGGIRGRFLIQFTDDNRFHSIERL